MILDRFFSKTSHDIGIDLGTSNTLVYVKGRGIVVNEPSVVAINQKTGKILSIGKGALKIIGRTPPHIEAIRPLVDGVISDFEATEEMLKYFIGKVHKDTLNIMPRPRVVISIPTQTTEVERKSTEDAALAAGAREVFLIEEPMAAALGAKLPTEKATGSMVIDIGGGTTELALISMSGIVNGESLKLAGDKLDEDILHYVRDEFNLLIGQPTAEKIKLNIASVYPLKQELTLAIRGRDLTTGLPKEVLINNDQAREAIFKTVEKMVGQAKALIEKSPPELVADLMDRGIVIAGGGALLRGLAPYIARETGIPARLEEDPLTTVVRGTGMALENFDSLSEIKVNV